MPLDVFQQVFSLSLASNLVNYTNGTQDCLQKTLQLGLNRFLREEAPGWELAWGPAVWKKNPDNDKTGPGNSWYVAFHPRLQFEDGSVRPTYVIAVAGTPEESKYVWFFQAFAVSSVANFNAWVSGGIQDSPRVVPAAFILPGIPYIATGIVKPVHRLLTFPAPEGAVGAGTTLLDLVADAGASDDIRFITTGHSLGGALSPSLALALVSAGIVPADNVLAYPTAGPTPGNKAFAELFADTFPAIKSEGAKSYQGWNLNLVNTIDAVPQAWSVQKEASPKQNLYNIPTLYGKPPLPLVQRLTDTAVVNASLSGVRYFPLPSQYFERNPPPTAPETLNDWMITFGRQHENEYFKEVGVERPQLDDRDLACPELTQKTEDEKWFNYIFVAALQWAIEHPEEAEEEMRKVENSGEAKAINLDELD